MHFARLLQLLFKHGSTAVAAQVMPTAAIENIKAAVAPKLQSSVDDLVLTYEGTVLEDGKKVEEYKIKSGATVEVTITRKLGAVSRRQQGRWDGDAAGAIAAQSLALLCRLRAPSLRHTTTPTASVRSPLQTLSKAWDRTVEWAPTVAFYAAVPVVLYIATTRRGAGWRDVWANVRMPFYD